MGITNFDSLSVGGVPIFGNGGPWHFPTRAGKQWFVDATNGSDGNDGLSVDRPFSTLAKAVGLATNNAGDVIWVFPGTYAENITITSKNYLTIVGAMGNGYARPDIAPTTGVAIDSNTTHGLTLVNLRLYSSDSDVIQQEGNGFRFVDCVFDGDTSMAATEALVRLKGNASDDGYTASEGRIVGCLFRGSNGYALAFDVGTAPTNGIGVTHMEVHGCRFIDNAGEDMIALDTGSGAVYSVQDSLFAGCYFMKKNKATFIDISTTNGSGNSDNVWAGCFFADDTINTTAIKMASTGSAVVGCYSLDGVIDGDALD